MESLHFKIENLIVPEGCPIYRVV